jgi:hypothetical protein
MSATSRMLHRLPATRATARSSMPCTPAAGERSAAPARAGCAATNAATRPQSAPRHARSSQAAPCAASSASSAAAVLHGGVESALGAAAWAGGAGALATPCRNSAASCLRAGVSSRASCCARPLRGSVSAGQPIQCAITRHSSSSARVRRSGHPAALSSRSRPSASQARCAGEGTACDECQPGGGPASKRGGQDLSHKAQTQSLVLEQPSYALCW